MAPGHTTHTPVTYVWSLQQAFGKSCFFNQVPTINTQVHVPLQYSRILPNYYLPYLRI